MVSPDSHALPTKVLKAQHPTSPSHVCGSAPESPILTRLPRYLECDVIRNYAGRCTHTDTFTCETEVTFHPYLPIIHWRNGSAILLIIILSLKCVHNVQKDILKV